MTWKKFIDPKTRLLDAGICEICTAIAFTYMWWPLVLYKLICGETQ